MTSQLEAFIDHLRLNRNTSVHTSAAYQSDLTQLIEFAAGHLGKPLKRLRPRDLDLAVIRAYMAELYRLGQSRASVARKLSALRTFVTLHAQGGLDRYRPGGAGAGAAARAQGARASLDGRDDDAARGAGRVDRRSDAAIARFWSCSTRRDCV